MSVEENLANRLVAFFEKFASWEHGVVRESGLTLSQMHAIEMIGHSGPVRMKDLAGEMGITTGTLTVMVDRLEKQGLVERRRHETDRRSYRIALTKEGTVYFDDHHRHHLELTREMTAGFSAEEMAVLHDLMGRMMERI